MAYFKTQIEKLEKGNYQPWKFRISIYLMGKGLWGLVTGDEPKPYARIENPTENQQRAIKEWEERDCRGDEKWKPFTTSVYVRDTLPNFEQLTTLMLTEELNHGVNRANRGQDQVFFARRGRGHGNRGGGRGQARAGYYNDNHDNQTSHDHYQSSRGRGQEQARERGGWFGGRSNYNSCVCYVCGKPGHYANNCYQWHRGNNNKNQGNYASLSNNQENKQMLVMNHSNEEKSKEEVCYIDSGCSNHMSGREDFFSNLQPPKRRGFVETGDNMEHAIQHTGDVRLGEGHKASGLSKVLHAPTIAKNLISVGKMVDNNYQVKFNHKGCFIQDPKNGYQLIANGKKEGRMFTLDIGQESRHKAMYVTNDSRRIGDLDLWHKRCGHINIQRLKDMEKRQVQKLDMFAIFQNFKACVEKASGRSIKTLRSDGGGEYFSHEFNNFLLEHGIRRQTTCMYTPQQNGVAERKNRYIVEVARRMLNEMHVPLFYWADAVTMANYIMNRCPTAGIHEKTPEEELRSKMDAHAEKCIFIGYSLEKKGYRCYNPNTKQLQVSQDVVFDELKSWYCQESTDMEEAEKQHATSQQESLEESCPSNNRSSSIKARRVHGYIKHTVNDGLFYAYDGDLHAKGFSDADWARAKEDKRSISGYVFMLGMNTISWSSKKLPTVALSSTEVEYRALALATCEIMWLKKIFKDLNVQVNMFPLYGNNMSSIYLAGNPMFHAQSKHIEVHYHFIREKVLVKEVDIQYSNTKKQVADIMTKFLDAAKIMKFKTKMGLRIVDTTQSFSLRGSVRILVFEQAQVSGQVSRSQFRHR
ncbi:hypothetical protein L7F22_023160 [Adiantum nelumboides]|nr:hypothetical protein [Adiantum nelumboides]